MTIAPMRRLARILLPVTVFDGMLLTACGHSDGAVADDQGASTTSAPADACLPTDDGAGVSILNHGGVTLALIVATDPNAVAGQESFDPTQVIYGQMIALPDDPSATFDMTFNYQWDREGGPDAGNVIDDSTVRTVSGCTKISTQIGPLDSGGRYSLTGTFLWQDDSTGYGEVMGTSFRIS